MSLALAPAPAPETKAPMATPIAPTQTLKPSSPTPATKAPMETPIAPTLALKPSAPTPTPTALMSSPTTLTAPSPGSERSDQSAELSKKDDEIEILRARLYEAELLNAKLQKDLEEAYDLLRQQAVTEKGTDKNSNKAHDLPRHLSGREKVPDKRSKKAHSDREKVPQKWSKGRSRIRSRIARCHDIILCENEVGALQVLDLLGRPKYKILHEVDVPGVLPDPYDKDKPKKKLEALTPFGKILFLGMIDDLYRLHRAGLSLDGKFTLMDFCWLKNKKVKLGADLKDHMLRRSRKRINRDYRRLCELMRLMLAQCEVQIPVDLQFLLSLMESDDPVSEQFLIRYNICLMDEISKRTYTLTLYDRLDQLDVEDAVKFGQKNKEKYRSAAVYDYIIAGDEDWSNSMTQNMFVNLIYGRWCRDKGSGPYHTRRQLVKLLRHCLVRLPQKAYYHNKIRYTDASVVGMLEMLTPGVFSQFQAGMYAIKQLAYPHLMHVMRV
ncbi:uncharacterized protein LOC133902902 isoform X2 [Phragmites australis]|uniref:uncharacterized protein LOC133902902 isoform X2 n=1 Tax=Phragmites australis TaxID=29695 RepID=UPI002D774545|nr:uncharacterized protein LOC133902902 isoform X2 [Phragmites australis]